MAPLGISQQALFDYRAKHDDLPSGNLTYSYWKWLFIVDLPIENYDFP